MPLNGRNDAGFWPKLPGLSGQVPHLKSLILSFLTSQLQHWDNFLFKRSRIWIFNDWFWLVWIIILRDELPCISRENFLTAHSVNSSRALYLSQLILLPHLFLLICATSSLPFHLTFLISDTLRNVRLDGFFHFPFYWIIIFITLVSTTWTTRNYNYIKVSYC